jgi:hypothetical protein
VSGTTWSATSAAIFSASTTKQAAITTPTAEAPGGIFQAARRDQPPRLIPFVTGRANVALAKWVPRVDKTLGGRS